MVAKLSEDSIRDILDLVESKELELLEIGITDSFLTKTDVDQIAVQVVGSNSKAYVDELISRGALFELSVGIRSRMAETVRLFSRLRQSFPSGLVTEGKPLVWDYRILRKPRRRPESDTKPAELIAAIPQLTELQKQIIHKIAPEKLRKFQSIGTQEVLARLKDRTESGVMISAGTGSGKTLAFYLPTILAITELLRGDQTNWVKTLAIYPRNELLKDQFSSILSYVFDVSLLDGCPRPLRIGAWFGDTPHQAKYAESKWKRDADRSSLIFPLAKCPKCRVGKLLWRDDDRKNGSERLICGDSKCGMSLPNGMIALTRNSISDHPPDILFSTTESINRQLADSGSHKAFGLEGAERLRMVLLDEVHTYEGLTGAQNAFLLRRIKHLVQSPIVWVGLSATLTNAEDFMGQLVNLPPSRIQVVKPHESELKPFGAEYSIALRHDPTRRHGVISLTLQATMLMGRVLDMTPEVLQRGIDSKGIFGKRSFIFTDKLDVTNRLYWQLMDIEGWDSPGNPKTGKGPQTLAHLRSGNQTKLDPANRESKNVRDVDGQWWQISEILGHNMDVDRRLRVTRVSSQEPGVDDKSELVVATATLEVGYSDDNVGAVIQHKAPSDPARFIQRKGRAGRSIEMRPWTVVTLSEWGRDKLAWQLYDQFLFPQVVNRHLPINNRYVQRIQAVYATMDWLALRLALVGNYGGSTRTDLVGPANVIETTVQGQKNRLTRQRRAQAILEDILARGPEFDAWQLHLKNALDLSMEEIDFLLVNPPRPLLLSLIPTIQRRLATQWVDEPVDLADPDVQYRNPLTEFAPASLFADLLSREVPVVVPTPNGAATIQPQDGDGKALPVLRILREFMPGNVSRHFGVKKTDRHWVNPTSPVIDVRSIYKATFVCDVVLKDGTIIAMYQPTLLTLETAPFNVQDSSSAAAVWQTNYDTVGDGFAVDLPPQLSGSALKGIRSLMHSNGSALRVQRFTTQSLGSKVVAGQGRIGISNTFELIGTPVAVGFEYEVDAIEINVIKVIDQSPTPWEKRDRAVEYLLDTEDLPISISSFDREKLGVLIQALAASAILEFGLQIVNLEEYDDLVLYTELEKVLDVVVGDEDDGLSGATPISNDASDDLKQLLQDPVVLNAIRNGLAFLDGRGADWALWRQRRLAVTVGACFLGACQIVVPDVDMDDLQLDISTDGTSVLISEMSPGGNGQIERIIEAISETGTSFTHAFRRQAETGELESLGNELTTAVGALSMDPDAREAGLAMLAAWAGGQSAVHTAFSLLESKLEGAEVLLSPALVTSLTSRFLGPSGTLESVDFAYDLRQEIDTVSTAVGFDVDFRVALWLVEKLRSIHLCNKHPVATSGRDLRRVIEILSWPVGRSAALYDLSPRSGFSRLPYADRQLMAGYLGRKTVELVFKVDPMDDVTKALLDDGEVLLKVNQSEITELRKTIVNGLANPMESGPLLVYPKVTGLELVNGQLKIRLALEEGSAWVD